MRLTYKREFMALEERRRLREAADRADAIVLGAVLVLLALLLMVDLGARL